MSVSGGWAWLNGTSYATIKDRANIDTRVMAVAGDPEDGNTKFYQDIPINRPGKETYVLSGWVKANAVPDNVQTVDTSDPEALAKDANKQCGLRAVVYYTNGTTEYQTEFHYVPFNPDLSGWQYVSMAVVPKLKDATVSRIRVTCTYERNANTAYFDDIALVQEVAQTMDYDENGNLKSVVSTGQTTETSEFDSNNNLIKAITGGHGTYVYNYVGGAYPHRVSSMAIQNVATQTYEYDAVGNVTSATLAPASSSSISLTTTASNTNNGNLLASTKNAFDVTTNYSYANNFSKAFVIPTSITDSKSVATSQTVDAFGRITNSSVYSPSLANLNTLVYTYNSKFQLDKVNRTASNVTQTYDLNYDTFGNLSSVYVGSQKLAGYTYNARNRLLSWMTYGNGHIALAQFREELHMLAAVLNTGYLMLLTEQKRLT